MTKLFKNSRVKDIVKKALCGILIGSMLAISTPVTIHAQPKSGGFIGKLTTFMLKEKIKENKSNKIKAEKQQDKERREKISEDYSKRFKDLNQEDLIGLGNLVNEMLDGYCKDITDLTRKQLESRIKLRLKNKKLTKKHYKEVEKYIDKRVYLHQICEMEGKGFVTVSPSGSITFTSNVPVLAY